VSAAIDLARGLAVGRLLSEEASYITGVIAAVADITRKPGEGLPEG
jgi:hypothetical protein